MLTSRVDNIAPEQALNEPLDFKAAKATALELATRWNGKIAEGNVLIDERNASLRRMVEEKTIPVQEGLKQIQQRLTPASEPQFVCHWLIVCGF